MALKLAPFASHGSNLLHSSNLLPTLVRGPPAVHHLCVSDGRPTKFRARSVVKDQDSLLPMITELQLGGQQEQKQEEKHQDELFRDPNSSSLRPNEQLAERWREIHGSNDWAGLLDPMDPLLRSELIRYGEFVQACYDSFDYNPYSRYCGTCRYDRRRFFESLGLSGAGYDVTRYLYATSNFKLPKTFIKSKLDSRIWSDRANWIGYVAVSDDATTALLGRRDILIAWRGTITRLEWMADLMDILRPVRSEGIPCPDPEIKVESGFVNLYTEKEPTCRFCKYSAREQVLAEVKKQIEHYTAAGEEVSLSVTGHSLGSALAMLSAYDIVETGLAVGADVRKVPVAVFSFSGPRVGNQAFKERFESIGIKALRVVNVHDTVPKVPGMIFNEHVPDFIRKFVDDLPWTYSHVGVELALDHKRSPFLKDVLDPPAFHNLEALLHTLDGYHGKGHKFQLTSGRDPALVNKSADFLKDHHLVPPFWRQDENKGMVQTHNGRWVQDIIRDVDEHPEDTHHHLQQIGLTSPMPSVTQPKPNQTI